MTAPPRDLRAFFPDGWCTPSVPSSAAATPASLRFVNSSVEADKLGQASAARPEVLQRSRSEGAAQWWTGEAEGLSTSSWLSPPTPISPLPPLPRRNSTVSLALPAAPPSSTFNPSQHALALSSPPRLSLPLPLTPMHAASAPAPRSGFPPPSSSFPPAASPPSAASFDSFASQPLIQHPSSRPRLVDLRRKSEGDALCHPYYRRREALSHDPSVKAARAGAEENAMELDLSGAAAEREAQKEQSKAAATLAPFLLAAAPSTKAEGVEDPSLTVKHESEEEGDDVEMEERAAESSGSGEDEGSLTLYFNPSRGVFVDPTALYPLASLAAGAVAVRFEPGEWVPCFNPQGAQVFPGNAGDRNAWLRAQLLNPTRNKGSGRCVCTFVFRRTERRSCTSVRGSEDEDGEGLEEGQAEKEVWKRPSVCRNHLAKCKRIHPNDPLKRLCQLLLEFEERKPAPATARNIKPPSDET